MPYKLYNCDCRRILVLKNNIFNITLLKLISLSFLILINIILVFPLLVRAYFLNLFKSLKIYKTIVDYISDIFILEL